MRQSAAGVRPSEVWIGRGNGRDVVSFTPCRCIGPGGRQWWTRSAVAPADRASQGRRGGPSGCPSSLPSRVPSSSTGLGAPRAPRSLRQCRGPGSVGRPGGVPTYARRRSASSSACLCSCTQRLTTSRGMSLAHVRGAPSRELDTGPAQSGRVFPDTSRGRGLNHGDVIESAGSPTVSRDSLPSNSWPGTSPTSRPRRRVSARPSSTRRPRRPGYRCGPHSRRHRRWCSSPT